MSRLPDFVIIGAAKCGTTTLYKKLAMHPKVFMSTPKEPEFFARDDIYQNGLDWYAELFASAGNTQICGEASTLYSLTTLFPHTVSRMHSAIPQAKLIYILREPVERTFSYYTQLVKNYQNSTRNFHVNRSFDECLFPEQHPNRCDRELFFAPHDKHLPDDPRSLIDGSRYVKHIKNYLRAFDSSQLLLIDFDQLVEKPDEVMATVCKFLDLNIDDIKDQKEIRENISSEHFKYIDKETLKQNFVAKVKTYAIGRKLVEITPNNLKKIMLNCYTLFVDKPNYQSRPQKMSVETHSYLANLFNDELIELEKIWQRDLSSWKKS